MSELRTLTLVCDANSDERLYIDGVAWTEQTDGTVYGGEIIYAADGKPCILEEKAIDHSFDQWPEKLEDALKEPESEITGPEVR